MNCPNCGAENPATNLFCDSCGAKLARKDTEKQQKKKNISESRNVQLNAPAPTRSVAAEPGGATLSLPAIPLETLAWAVIFVVGAFLLFYRLDLKPLHHDESLHAYYAWELFKGLGYKYNPMMHGPFLFHANALVYFLFGASDYTCRIMPALAGMVVLVMTFFLRPYLGRAGALFTAAIIAVSPSFTYFGRFIRNDIYIAADSMLMVFGFFRYLDTRKPKYLYLAALGLALAFCTKEVTYINGAIFVTFMLFRWLWEYTMRTAGGENKFVPALQEMLKQRKPLWMSAAIFLGLVLVLYTTVFTNPRGFLDAFTASLTYWLGQHEVQRGSQPVYFYAGLIPLYEVLTTLGTLGALVYYGFIKDRAHRVWRLSAYLILASAWWLFSSQGHETFGLIFSLLLVTLGVGMLAYFSFAEGNGFVTFLQLWTLAAFSDYSFAGERMPWLILHPLLPMVLLTGFWLGELWNRFQRQRAWLLTAFGLGAALLLHNTSLVNFYGNGANPAELLVYVQSAPDTQQVTRQLTNMSKRLTGGLEMKITCEDYCSWPFAWYLRDFKFVGYPKFTATQAPGSIEENPVIITGVEMAAPGHDDRVAELLAEKYVAQRYKLRVWWAPDSGAFFNDTFGGKVKKIWRLMVYKEPWSGLGSYDMIVYVRKDLAHLYWSHAE